MRLALDWCVGLPHQSPRGPGPHPAFVAEAVGASDVILVPSCHKQRNGTSGKKPPALWAPTEPA